MFGFIAPDGGPRKLLLALAYGRAALATVRAVADPTIRATLIRDDAIFELAPHHRWRREHVAHLPGHHRRGCIDAVIKCGLHSAQ